MLFANDEIGFIFYMYCATLKRETFVHFSSSTFFAPYALFWGYSVQTCTRFVAYLASIWDEFSKQYILALKHPKRYNI